MSTPLAERYIFLRPLSLLRIRHQLAWWQNWALPMIFFIPIFISSLVSAKSSSTSILGTLSDEIGLINILLPFTVTSLAVVAGLAGPKTIDEKFNMAEPVKLYIERKGDTVPIDVTPRHFVCLLLSYITMACIFCLMINSILGPIATLVPIYVDYISSYVFLFLYSQILSFSLLAVYLLGDYLSRSRIF